MEIGVFLKIGLGFDCMCIIVDWLKIVMID